MKILTSFYSNKFPEEGDMVYGKIVKFNEYGIKVLLKEYNDMEAFVNYRDASNSKRIKNIKKQLKNNKSYAFTVVSVDKDKEFIDFQHDAK